MTAGRAAWLAAVAVLAAGCGAKEIPPPSPACTSGRTAIVAALARAPRVVALPDGTALSSCIRHARADSDLQNVGIVFSQAAEDLEARAFTGDARAAVELGYLVGATRRGAKRNSGINDELVRRIERSAALDGTPGAIHAAVERGITAGEARG